MALSGNQVKGIIREIVFSIHLNRIWHNVLEILLPSSAHQDFITFCCEVVFFYTQPACLFMS